MAEEKIISISLDDFTEKLMEFSRKYGQENFWGEELPGKGKTGIIRFYTEGDEDKVGFAAIKGEMLSYWMENDKETVYVVKYSKTDEELFNALYNALEHGFTVEDNTEE